MINQSIEEMVEWVSWMSPADYEILLFFEEHDIIVSPKILAINIEYDRQYVSKRCNELAENDLLDNPDSGVYQLSEFGRQFLDGKIDAEELEHDDQS